jgi:hypothetical protein
VQITSVTATATASGKLYATHGSATATLVAQGGASGTVMMTITF